MGCISTKDKYKNIDIDLNVQNEVNSTPNINNNKEIIFLESINEHYELGNELGHGGFSVVLEGKSKKDGSKVAIKCIKKNTIEGNDMIMLKREIEIMKSLDHPHILELYEVFENDEEVYLVMELVEGHEVYENIIIKGRYTEKEARHIISQVISAVEYIHSKGIIHRDLKPENLLSSGGEDNEYIKIADFGFSKELVEDKMMTSCGSPGYVAPEVLISERYDSAVDMWSIGVILYILLCGYPPFYEDNAPALFRKIIDAEYDFDDPIWNEVSEDAKNLIRNLLIKDPEKRLTAKQVLQHTWLKSG